MSNEIVCVRLVNGDEILGRLKSGDSVDDTKFTLEKVRHLLVQRTPEGLGVTLMPWSFCNIDGDVKVSASGVIALLKPSAETITSYQEQTTGIQLLS